MRLVALVLLAFPVLHAQTSNLGILVDASRFLDRLPRGTTIADERVAGGWIFNNFGLSLRSTDDCIATVSVDRPGKYNLLVHSWGKPTSGFRVQVDDKDSPEVFGNAPLGWKNGGSFDLTPGQHQIRVTGVVDRPGFDLLVLTAADSVSEEQLKPLQFNGAVEVLKEYKVPRGNPVKFGDLTGDGKIDFVAYARGYSVVAFDHSGQELWKWDAPEENARLRNQFEAPGSIWDFDGDGAGELVHWRLIDGKEWLVMADGKTGAVKAQVEWPTTPMPHVYNNFRTAIAKLKPGRPQHLVVFTDSGGTSSITAYDNKLKQLWQHVEKKKKDHLGHYIYPMDLTKDGIDEICVSHLCLDANGRTAWNRFDVFDDNHDHADDIKLADVNGDGEPELLCSTSDVGLVIYNARTGAILMQAMADHAQQVESADLLPHVPGPEIVVNGRVYGRPGEGGLSAEVFWFDNKANLISKWPGAPLNGNPDFVKGDWTGTGKQDVFWHRFRLNSQGKGDIYFGESLYHMFDFMGNGAEQVITREGEVMKVYGAKGIKPKAIKRDAEYQRHQMANHSHY